MAERYAVATGLWTAATFNGGTLPGVDDIVHANGYIVTIDQDISVTTLSTRAGSVAVAGGYFAPSGNRTIYANCYAGTEVCIRTSNSAPLTTVHGNVYGSDTATNVYGIYGTGSASSLIVSGNVYGGSITGGIGIVTINSANLTVFGNLYGGSGITANGVRIISNGTSVIRGNCYGSATSTTGTGFANATASGTMTIYGNCYGNAAPGAANSVGSSFSVLGDAIGGTAYSTGGISISESLGGNIYLYGTARSSPTGLGAGAYNGSTGSACIFVQAAEQGAGGGWPVSGKVLFHDFNNITFGVRNAANTLKTIGVLPHSSFSTPRAFT